MTGGAADQLRTLLCAANGCDRKVYCRGYCTMHYQRWRRHGGDCIRYCRWPEPSERIEGRD